MDIRICNYTYTLELFFCFNWHLCTISVFSIEWNPTDNTYESDHFPIILEKYIQVKIQLKLKIQPVETQKGKLGNYYNHWNKTKDSKDVKIDKMINIFNTTVSDDANQSILKTLVYNNQCKKIIARNEFSPKPNFPKWRFL